MLSMHMKCKVHTVLSILTLCKTSLLVQVFMEHIDLCLRRKFYLLFTGLHLGGGERGHLPPLKTGWPLGYVVCIVTYIILKRFMNHMMSHHSYLIKIKFLH